MKNLRTKFSFISALIVLALFACATFSYAATGRQLVESAASSLKATASTTTVSNIVSIGWTWTELKYNDETYPLTVDLVGSNFQSAHKVIYLLPGGGVNFKSSFFTPLEDNLAQYLRKAGYLVVGITPRENNVPAGVSYSCMINWGLDKHRTDIRKIIKIIQTRINLPYRILGHSFGAAYALDYAGHYADGLEKIIALDIYSFDPGDAQKIYASGISYDAFLQLISQGQYADSSYSDIKSLMLISLLLPRIDAGTSRVDLGYPGDFTFEGLLYFSMIDSYLVPGIHTPLTGLPGDWPLVQSYASGSYNFAQNPLNDSYSLNHSDMCTLREAGFKVGSGLVPCALYRDFFAVNAYNGAYAINWSGINKPVLWVNTELGYGNNLFGATLIRNAGNQQVSTAVIPGYGHLDALSSKTAKEDVWHLFVE
jgi:pimeloyl-ACP methyl ester carboxylesterase